MHLVGGEVSQYPPVPPVPVPGEPRDRDGLGSPRAALGYTAAVHKIISDTSGNIWGTLNFSLLHPRPRWEENEVQIFWD